MGFIIGVESLIVKIAAGREQCFFENAKRGEKVLASYTVLAKDIDITILAPDMSILFKDTKATEDSFQFVASHSGPYRLCFGNKMSTISSKEIDFNVYVGNSLEKKNVVKTEHLTPLEHVIVALRDGMRTVEDRADYIIHRQERSYSTNESTDIRVFWFSVLETTSLLVVGAFQIFYIRRLF